MGAIDVGTNTTRLLVAEPKPRGGYRDLERRLIFTRLGEDLSGSGEISSLALKRTLDALTEFCSLCGELEVATIRIAATSAVRDAANREVFLSRVQDLTGVNPEVLSGDSEAALTFRGATAGLASGRYLVADIGGGSTEFVIGAGLGPQHTVSVDIGSVRLTERHLYSDPPAVEEILIMEGEIDEALDGVEGELPDAGESRLVGVAGTVTSLAALHLGLEKYDPGRTHLAGMTRGEVSNLYKMLASMTIVARHRLGLPEGRADIIVAGASILARTMSRWSFDRVTVSEKDILDGLVLDMLSR